MSNQPTLTEALAIAQARAASLIDTPAPPAPEAATVALLRVIALAHGIAPDGVERSFLEGGPLADLVRAVLGTECEGDVVTAADSNGDRTDTSLATSAKFDHQQGQ